MMMRPLVWFRNDLRVFDNPALYHASGASDRGLAAVYFVTPGQWKEHGWGEGKVDFVMQNLETLLRDLESLGVPLLVERLGDFGDVPAALLKLARKHRCDALYFNSEYEVNERRRDEAVRTLFEEADIPVSYYGDQTVVEPGELRTKAGGCYSVYGAFRRAFLDTVVRPGALETVPRPKRQKEPICRPGSIPGRIPGYKLSVKVADRWPAGEKRARSQLRSFLRSKAAGYEKGRDFPDGDATSRLSPYLALGVLSSREALARAIDANGGRLQGGKGGISIWINQLIWREFYRHVMFGFPHVSMDRPFRSEGDSIPWRYNEKDFQAWCEGRTGYPIVDAGMRQLNETGWMHNRLRMITAMFLTKHLLIDWRWGERYFMQKLIDADLANNNGGWQWSASTGTDAAPYFRIFNPWTQSRNFDGGGDFIRRYVPELQDVRSADLHDQERMKQLHGSLPDYPLPIVDHRAARERAIETFRAVLGKGKARS